MLLRTIYDEKLAQAAYLIGCQRTGEAILIDPERDVDRYLALAAEHDLRITHVAETHVHADFVSGARELAARTNAEVLVSGEGGADWTPKWVTAHPHRILHDGDVIRVGGIELAVVHTPGHTPEHVAYLVTDRGGGANEPIGMVTGDFVFVGDLGRPDLLETAAGQEGMREPSARRLRETVARLDRIPDFVQVWPAHGAGSACGKALGAVPSSTIGYERRFNPGLRLAGQEAAFLDYVLAGQPEPPMYFATMKRINKDGPPVLGALPIPPRMTPAEVAELDPRAVAIVDTRPWKAYRDGHLHGALSLPLGRRFNTDAGSLIGEAESIVLLIEPGRVEEAVRELVRVGLDHLEGWCDASELEAVAAAGGRLERAPEVTADEAGAMLDDPRVQVLDVRRATENAESSIPGAINVAHTRLPARVDEVPRDRHLLVHCRSGVRSAAATSWLRRHGFEATNLAGGMLAWQRAHAAATE